MRRMLALSIALGVAAPVARADEVELNGGTRIAGDVLARDDAGVRLLLASNEEILLATADVKRVVISEGAPGGDSFTRGEKSGDHPGLQTGVVHYLKAGAPRVDLVGAVHAADLAYFHEVQALLDREEVVLYEMIKKQGQDPGAKADDAAREQSPVSKFQVALGRALDLSFQLDGIDYRRRHFVHADLTAEEFLAGGGGALTKELAAMVARIGPMLALAEKALNPGDDASPERKASARAMRSNVKSMLASMLGAAASKGGGLLAGMGGDELILTKRNDVAMSVFDATPKDVRSIAIFYGAAHMPDLEKRLLARGYARAGGHWLTAWDIGTPKEATPPAKAPEPAPASAK